MTEPVSLYEVSWEVCHEVGGVHAVLSSKARTLVDTLGDAYVAVGPWLLSEGNAEKVLDVDPAFDAFSEGCRAAGVPVRVGRWRIPGAPRAVRVEFSGLYAKKDQILESLWQRFKVDSLLGGWDYVEPVLFGHAAGIVVERWSREFGRGPAVAQFHEWMAGAGLLYLKEHAPGIGSVFTAHATIVGRSIAAAGKSPAEALAGRTPAQVASELSVAGKHSLESACAREADVLTTVSPLAAEEVALVHGRAPDVVLPNGIDLDALSAAASTAPDARVRETLLRVASRFTGDELGDARIVVSAGRNEFHTKGFDLLLAAAAQLGRRSGRMTVVYLFVPAAHSGVRREVAERLRGAVVAGGPVGVATHQLVDAATDPIVARCAELGLTNVADARVKIVYLPAYLHGDDGALNLPYEAVVRAADLAVFPSLYEAWGCAPQESLALGVPTVTTDCAGFGRWAAEAGIGPADGLHILPRRGKTFEQSRDALAAILDAESRKSPELSARCRAAAARTSWTSFVAFHRTAFAKAVEAAVARPAAPLAAHRFAPVAAVQGARPRVFPLEVANVTPPELSGLEGLARNWRFTWDPHVAALFQELSPATWEKARGNPLRTLREAPPADLAACSHDVAYLKRVEDAVARTAATLGAPHADSAPISTKRPVAYICAEFALHECLPIYSGGLGVLAGDHLRAASDVGLPLVAVGLLYRKGYMRQRLQGGVDQLSLVDEVDPRRLPLTLVTGADGRPVEVTLNLPGTQVAARAWRADVGRTTLYLLDSDFERNRPEDRSLTHSLYSGNSEHRVRQEIVLGRGGARLLAKLGVDPAVWHVNEGHGALVVIERAWQLVRDQKLTFEEAREAVRASTVFTTHTPVPAGHDVFDEDLMRRHYSHTPGRLGLSWERFYALGASPEAPGFNMTNLALGFSSFVNGVSRRHGEVTRRLLASTCPHLATEELPVTSVTNGVHLSAWTSVEIAELLGAKDRPVTGVDFARAESLDPTALWSVRRALRRRLVVAVATHLMRAFDERDDSPSLLETTLAGLAGDALFLGFARRFATYKRADLLLRDPARLRAILDSSERPVRLLLAGKAHPRDHAAKEMLAKLARVARSDEFVGRVIVLENYDMALARTLVQGVDVWLNTPRPPLEASGTSGMKAAANGALNVSVGDGWWLEGWSGANGWLVGAERPAATEAVQDEIDAASLYRRLETDVTPLFFRRDEAGVPREWLQLVARSLATIPPVFDAARMVAEYRDRAYVPLASRSEELRADGHAGARALAARNARLAAGFREARILSASVGDAATVGGRHEARVDVDLATLSVDEVSVELVVGRRVGAELRDVVVVPLSPSGSSAAGPRRYTGSFEPHDTGSFGCMVRLRPKGSVSLHDPAVWA